MEIEIGEYIKTKSGDIRQVVDFCDCKPNHLILDKTINGDAYLLQDEIVNQSKNIIDLIKEGDILILWDREYNEQYKSEVFLDYDNNLCVTNFEKTKILDLKIELFRKAIKIKSIVTREKMKSVEYNVLQNNDNKEWITNLRKVVDVCCNAIKSLNAKEWRNKSIDKEKEYILNHIAPNNENKYLYKAEYMQNPFDILTEDNLKRLEEHCKETIQYERRKIKEEHEIVLCLLYRYQDLQKKLEDKNKNNILEC